MSAPLSFKVFLEQKLGKAPQVVIYAILEWMMIILLFVDGLLAFISNEFAKFFDLRVPCLLCTRIDHILVHRDPSFYYNESICEVHKKDLSSLAYCHMHKKLSDIRSMCQGCLLSFATGKESDCEKYKSLVGILNRDVDSFMEEQKPWLKTLKNDDAEVTDDNKSDNPLCSCCGESLKSKVTKYMRSLSINGPTPSPRALRSKNNEGLNIGLPQIRYKEANSSSDTESEVPEDEGLNIQSQGGQHVKTTVAAPLLPNSEDISAGAYRTPTFARGNKYFGTSFEAALLSPRWASRVTSRPPVMELNNTSPNEADGNMLSRLKNQLCVDQKSLLALYEELDEERSAAAVAANNAMAMITRLQAEKAAVQMEALQYQRMMEEQAEYDEEALQIMRDLVLKREEEMKVLESELEMYRDKYGPIKRVGSDICEVDVDDIDCRDMKLQSLSDCSSLSGGDQNDADYPFGHPMESVGGNQEATSLDFEGERSFLLGLLTDLEKRMMAQEGLISSNSGEMKGENEGTGSQNKAILTREMSLMRERLRAIEAESGFLKHVAMTLQKGDEGTKLLAEIAQHLRGLRHSAKSPSDNTDA